MDILIAARMEAVRFAKARMELSEKEWHAAVAAAQRLQTTEAHIEALDAECRYAWRKELLKDAQRMLAHVMEEKNKVHAGALVAARITMT
jgi:hypothetical protein